jgi:hypothetical protein
VLLAPTDNPVLQVLPELLVIRALMAGRVK